MCLAVPAEVVSIDGPSALVDVYGRRFVVSLMMMPDPIEPGDYVAWRRSAGCGRGSRARRRAGRTLLRRRLPQGARRPRRDATRRLSGKRWTLPARPTTTPAFRR